MGAPPVVVGLVLGQDQQQMPFAEDQHPVGDLGPGGELEPFRVSVRARAARRDVHGLDTGIGQDCVKRYRELPGPVPDQAHRLRLQFPHVIDVRGVRDDDLRPACQIRERLVLCMLRGVETSSASMTRKDSTAQSRRWRSDSGAGLDGQPMPPPKNSKDSAELSAAPGGSSKVA